MFRVHKQPSKFVIVTLKPVKHAQTYVVNAALHGSVHRFGVIVVVVLGPRRVQLLVTLFVVGLLEQDIRSDARFFEFSVIFNGRRRNVDVYAANVAVPVMNGIYGFDAFENIFDRVVHGVFARLYRKAFMPHILKRDDLFFYLLLRQFDAGDSLVFCVVRAVNAPVDAVI